jgi:hypothetical protein
MYVIDDVALRCRILASDSNPIVLAGPSDRSGGAYVLFAGSQCTCSQNAIARVAVVYPTHID